MGVVLEDLDALAGTVAFNHCDDNNAATRPLLLVTAAVDQISILRPFRLHREITMQGQVARIVLPCPLRQPTQAFESYF
jgi:acyl-coenzyme A thioesterase 9